MPSERRRVPTVGLARPLAGFAVVCGLILLVLPERPRADAPDDPPVPTVTSRARDGLVEAQHAQRALGEENYGEVRARLTKVQDSLTWILTQKGGTP